MSRLYQAIPGVPPTPRNYQPFDGKLELVCKACGKKGKYPVGRIMIDPEVASRPTTDERMDEAVCFTGYFHCRSCGAGGPWELTTATRLMIIALMAEALEGPQEQARVHVTQMRLFDGTCVRNTVEGEAHLRKLIDAEPDNYFLWSRLGNLFNSAEEDERSIAAFTKAVELNPLDVESHHSLAEYCMERNQPARAAEHFHNVLRHCRNVPPRTREKPEFLRALVRHTLECLCDLSQESKGQISFLPPEPLPRREDAGKSTESEEHVLVVRNFDLSSKKDWDDLVAMFLDPPPAPTGIQHPHRPLSGPRTPFPPVADAEARVGRNDPCPCGSGKKFKKCCGRA